MKQLLDLWGFWQLLTRISLLGPVTAIPDLYHVKEVVWLTGCVHSITFSRRWSGNICNHRLLVDVSPSTTRVYSIDTAFSIQNKKSAFCGPQNRSKIIALPVNRGVMLRQNALFPTEIYIPNVQHLTIQPQLCKENRNAKTTPTNTTFTPKLPPLLLTSSFGSSSKSPLPG